MKVWVALGTEDDGSDSGYRYVSSVFDSAEKAAAFEAKNWGIDITEVTVE